jgi:hypothetical protein
MNKAAAEKIIKDALDLMERKNADYGSDNISKTGVYGVAVRLTDKIHRLLNLTRPGAYAPNFEGIEDTFLDVLNYGLIGKMLLDGSWGSEEIPILGDEQHPHPTVYLAGSIDAVDELYAKTWRKHAKSTLANYGITSYDPSTAFQVGHNQPLPRVFISQINRAALASCQGMVVNMTDKRGFGTIREIEMAKSLGKTVVVWGDKDELAKHVEAHDLDTWVYPDMENCLLVLARSLGAWRKVPAEV